MNQAPPVIGDFGRDIHVHSTFSDGRNAIAETWTPPINGVCAPSAWSTTSGPTRSGCRTSSGPPES